MLDWPPPALTVMHSLQSVCKNASLASKQFALPQAPIQLLNALSNMWMLDSSGVVLINFCSVSSSGFQHKVSIFLHLMRLGLSSVSLFLPRLSDGVPSLMPIALKT